MTATTFGGRQRLSGLAAGLLLLMLSVITGCDRDAGFYALDATYCDNRPCVCDSHFVESHPAKRVAIKRRRDGRAICPSNYWLAPDRLAETCVSEDCYCTRPKSPLFGRAATAQPRRNADGTLSCPADMILRQRFQRFDP